MNEFEQYLFDLQGFLVIENALTPAEVAGLNQELDRQVAAIDAPEKTWLRVDGLLGWGTAYQSLIDHPRLAPYLEALLASNFRLDHEYVHLIRQGIGPIGAELHGGGTPYDPCQYYHYRNDRMYNGLTTVAYNLTDVFAGEGGFGCIPGSHKSNLPLPKLWWDLTTPASCVQEVTGKAGTAIVFTEALTHGTLPWKGDRERRTVFYKYSPYPSAYSRTYSTAAQYSDLSVAQQRRLKTPGVYPPPTNLG